ncbi:HupE/UreJ family protein [Terrihabitans sp. B22-R8]|uniref:HupE/UreJ family protein n=1 Tax=Terrihabitans sp. B22-R8 TaxID=3425128 RepID=UPI00403CAF0F
MTRTPIAAFGLVAALAATPALAHTGVGDTHGFIHGFAHPIGGLDHVLAMVAVGLFASILGGRALWAVPAAFVGMMLVGGGLGITGVDLPAVELGITASIIMLGAVTALGLSWPLTAAMALVGFFALFHGHAHGAEMPLDADAFGYSAGFAAATILLHAMGVGAGVLVRNPLVVRTAGAAMALTGIALLVG